MTVVLLYMIDDNIIMVPYTMCYVVYVHTIIYRVCITPCVMCRAGGQQQSAWQQREDGCLRWTGPEDRSRSSAAADAAEFLQGCALQAA